jgi:hypothetical protein
VGLQPDRIAQTPIVAPQYNNRGYGNGDNEEDDDDEEEDYACPVCQRQFQLRSSLVQHFVAVHKSTNNRFF